MGLEIGRSAFNNDERVEFLRTLGGWLTSGSGTMSVNEAIRNTCEVFSREEYASFAARMDKITREFNEGVTAFHEGLRRADVGFTRQELAVIEGAEESDQLRIAIPSLVEALTMSFDARKQLKNKLFPMVIGGFMLLLLSLGVIIFMLPTVLGPVLERQPEALETFPFVIVWYWNASVFLRSNPHVPMIFIAIPIGIFLARNTAFFRPRIENMLMSMNASRRLIVAYNAVLIVYFMPTLVRAGIPLPQVLNILSNSVENLQIQSQLKAAAKNHEDGISLGEALAGLPLRTAFRSSVEAGEKTGAIADRVEELKLPFSSEYTRVMGKAISAMKMIIMIILLPFFIMSMYTSLVAPIFALMEF
jgi:type II secretory pathway component PulF